MLKMLKNGRPKMVDEETDLSTLKDKLFVQHVRLKSLQLREREYQKVKESKREFFIRTITIYGGFALAIGALAIVNANTDLPDSMKPIWPMFIPIIWIAGTFYYFRNSEESYEESYDTHERQYLKLNRFGDKDLIAASKDYYKSVRSVFEST